MLQDGCRASLAELKNESVKTSEDPKGQYPNDNEEKKIPGDDD